VLRQSGSDIEVSGMTYSRESTGLEDASRYFITFNDSSFSFDADAIDPMVNLFAAGPASTAGLIIDKNAPVGYQVFDACIDPITFTALSSGSCGYFTMDAQLVPYFFSPGNEFEIRSLKLPDFNGFYNYIIPPLI